MKGRKNLSVMVLAAASITGLGSTPPARHFLASANDFVSYYRALGQSNRKVGILERVALSLVLVSADSAQRDCDKKPPTSS
jgi:hypothetical protein